MAKEETVDGVRFVRTHSGQRQAYGDTFYDFAVFSDLPKEEVERVRYHPNDDTWECYGRMPNSIVTGWWYAGRTGDVLREIDMEAGR